MYGGTSCILNDTTLQTRVRYLNSWIETSSRINGVQMFSLKQCHWNQISFFGLNTRSVGSRISLLRTGLERVAPTARGIFYHWHGPSRLLSIHSYVSYTYIYIYMYSICTANHWSSFCRIAVCLGSLFYFFFSFISYIHTCKLELQNGFFFLYIWQSFGECFYYFASAPLPFSYCWKVFILLLLQFIILRNIRLRA